MTGVASQFKTELLDLVNDTVTIRPKSSRNGYGDPVYVGAGTSYPAYVQRVTSLSATLEKQNNIVKYKAYIPSTTLSVGMEDELTFSDGKIRDIIDIDFRRDEWGQQAVILAVGGA
jgi:hypothetical protein